MSAWLASQGSINSRKIPLESFIHAPSILDHSVLNLILIRMLKLSRETGVTQHLLSFSLTPRDLNQHSTSSITTQSASSSASGPSSSASGVASGGGGAGLRQWRGGSRINNGWRTWSCSCSMPASWGGQRFRSTSPKSTCKVRQTRHFHTQGWLATPGVTWTENKFKHIYIYLYLHIIYVLILNALTSVNICCFRFSKNGRWTYIYIYIYTYLHILNLFLINLFDVTWFATWLVEWICPKNDTTCFWILRSCLREDSQLPPTHRRQQNCRFVAHKLQCRCHGLQEQIMIQQKIQNKYKHIPIIMIQKQTNVQNKYTKTFQKVMIQNKTFDLSQHAKPFCLAKEMSDPSIGTEASRCHSSASPRGNPANHSRSNGLKKQLNGYPTIPLIRFLYRFECRYIYGEYIYLHEKKFMPPEMFQDCWWKKTCWRALNKRLPERTKRPKRVDYNWHKCHLMWPSKIHGHHSMRSSLSA